MKTKRRQANKSFVSPAIPIETCSEMLATVATMFFAPWMTWEQANKIVIKKPVKKVKKTNDKRARPRGCGCAECTRLPTVEQAEWADWVETVFWACQGHLKHGGHLFPDLCHLKDYRDLYNERTHKIGGDELHCMREQIFIEYCLPTKHENLWP